MKKFCWSMLCAAGMLLLSHVFCSNWHKYSNVYLFSERNSNTHWLVWERLGSNLVRKVDFRDAAFYSDKVPVVVEVNRSVASHILEMQADGAVISERLGLPVEYAQYSIVYNAESNSRYSSDAVLFFPWPRQMSCSFETRSFSVTDSSVPTFVLPWKRLDLTMLSVSFLFYTTIFYILILLLFSLLRRRTDQSVVW